MENVSGFRTLEEFVPAVCNTFFESENFSAWILVPAGQDWLDSGQRVSVNPETSPVRAPTSCGNADQVSGLLEFSVLLVSLCPWLPFSCDRFNVSKSVAVLVKPRPARLTT